MLTDEFIGRLIDALPEAPEFVSPLFVFAREIEKASRRAALEEAAKICELHSTDYNRRRRTSDNPTYMEGKSDGAEACASALYRALSKEQTK